MALLREQIIAHREAKYLEKKFKRQKISSFSHKESYEDGRLTEFEYQIMLMKYKKLASTMGELQQDFKEKRDYLLSRSGNHVSLIDSWSMIGPLAIYNPGGTRFLI